MSCETSSTKLSKTAAWITGGISRLASQRAFYAGLAAGVAGAKLSELAAARIRRRSRPVQAGGAASFGPAAKSIPLAGPGSRVQSQPTAEAGRAAPGTRANPKKISPAALQAPGSRVKPRQIPVLAGPPPETKLKEAPIHIKTGRGQPFTPRSSYRVVGLDGEDTGLALTPELEETEGGALAEVENAWNVTHTGTGAKISGPYPSIAQAHGLATRLSALPWTAARVPAPDIKRARQMIDEYQKILEGPTQ